MLKTDKLITSIVEGIQDRKGHSINVLDLSQIEGASAQAFVVCSGRSTAQVEAIADSVMEHVRKDLQDKPTHVHGYRNAQWIILDYGSVMVHIFLPETRTYYDLEGLWSDAPCETVMDIE